MGSTKNENYFGSRHRDAGLSGVIGFVGQPGVGKTYKAQRLIAKVKRGIYFDTPANVGHGERQNPMPGWHHVWGYAEFVNYLRANGRGPVSQADGYGEEREPAHFRIVYHPGEDAEKEFYAVCKLVFALRNVVFFVDEIWEFCTAGSMPKPLQRIAFRGRHPGITLVWTVQRPQLVASGLRSVTSQYYCFRIQDELDLDAMRGKIPAAAMELVPKLPDRSYIFRDEAQNWKVVHG